MTWYIGEVTRGGLQSHFIDGYEGTLSQAGMQSVRNGSPHPESGFRVAADIFYGAQVCYRASADKVTYPAIAREFARDKGPGHCAYVFVVRKARRSEEAIGNIPVIASLTPKHFTQFDNHIEFIGDVAGLMLQLITHHDDHDYLEHHVLRAASLHIAAKLAMRTARL